MFTDTITFKIIWLAQTSSEGIIFYDSENWDRPEICWNFTF